MQTTENKIERHQASKSLEIRQDAVLKQLDELEVEIDRVLAFHQKELVDLPNMEDGFAAISPEFHQAPAA